MQKIKYLIIALLCAVVQGAWATDYNVGNETDLKAAIVDGANIKLTTNIVLSNYLGIGDGGDSKPTVTIDLNGKTLSRSLTECIDNGSVIVVNNGSSLTINDSGTGGTITGGKSTSSGGGIRNNSGATLIINGGTISGNESNSYGGGVWNGKGATMTLAGGNISSNRSKEVGGGIMNGSTATLTITGGTVTGNSSDDNYGGVYSFNSFKMSGSPVIKDNTGANLFLHSSKIINVTGAFTEGAEVHVKTNNYNRAFTSGYSTYNTAAPGTIFKSDINNVSVILNSNEAYLQYGTIDTDDDLRQAISDGVANITLEKDYQVLSHLTIRDEITIDLNGHTLVGNNTPLDGNDGSFSCIFIVASTGKLTLTNGTLAGADNSLTTNATHNAGAIVNKGTVTLNNVTITNCKGTQGGAIRNNEGATLTLNGVNITGNTASDCGGGIYSDGSLNVSGEVKVTGNTGGNVYMTGSNLIYCTGAFSGDTGIGMSLEKKNRVFTMYFKVKNGESAEPGTYFTADNSNYSIVANGNEAELSTTSTTATTVSTEEELNTAITNGETTIQIIADIKLNDYVGIGDGKTVTLDLNGHTLSRSLTSSEGDGNVIVVNSGGTLTIKDSSGDNSGTITGGWANNGGGIRNHGTLTLEGGTITGNTGTDTSGGVYNAPSTANGTAATFTMTGGVITGNTGQDGGGIYNYESSTVTISGGTISNCTSNQGGGGVNNHGTATISGGTITGNHATSRGGGVWNGSNATLTITGGSITGNRADITGGGVFSYSNFSMSGNPDITGNDGSNLYLDASSVINCGTFTTGAGIGISLANGKYNRKFTSGYNTNNAGVAPTTYFSADLNGVTLSLSDNEAYMSASGILYVERSWTGGDTDGHVVGEVKSCTNYYNLGSTSNLGSAWYYAGSSGTWNDRWEVSGDAKLIIGDGVTLTCNKGIYIKDGCTLTIYAQEGGTGKLDVPTTSSDHAAIGGNNNAWGGSLVIHGGTVIAKAGHNNGAGIGGGDGEDTGMRSVVIWGGTVEAVGKSSGAGIGGGQHNCGPTVTIYGGTVTATAGNYAAGIGGGEDRGNSEVKIYGGTVHAKGGERGAGIGGGEEGGMDSPVTIYGGTVTAETEQGGAGIGGGYKCSNTSTITINGGSVTAKTDENFTSYTSSKHYGASGMGGGQFGAGGTIIINGGDVYSYSKYSTGIGSGKYDEDHRPSGGDIYINGGKVKAQGSSSVHCIGAYGYHRAYNDGNLTIADNHKVSFYYYTELKQTANTDDRVSKCRTAANGYVLIEPCNHGSKSYQKINSTQHKVNCNYCKGIDEEHSFNSSNICTKCNYEKEYWTGSGTGTQEDPYLITSESDWNQMVNNVNQSGQTYEGLYVKLVSDINVSEMMGSSEFAFCGTFDGDGHKINASIDAGEGAAPFRYVGGGCTIKNLRATGSVTCSSSSGGGGLVGFCSGSGTINIKNCHVNTNVSINILGGGIVGHGKYSKLYIEGCVYEGTITNTASKQYLQDDLFVGGLLGRCGASGGTFSGSIKNSYFKGSYKKNNSNVKFHPIITKAGFESIGSVSCENCYYNTNPEEDTTFPSNTFEVGKMHRCIKTDGNVTMSHDGTPTEYNVSGLTFYDGSKGYKYNNTYYAGKEEDVKLNLGYVAGYSGTGFKASDGALSGSANPYTLTMPNKDVTISAEGVREGDGSQETPYQVTSVDDMNQIATVVNDGTTDFEGKFFELTTDLDFSSSEYTPVGTESRPFKGIFNGKAHTISHISLSGEDSYQGIFGHIGAGGAVYNLKADNCTSTGAIIAGTNKGSVAACVSTCGNIVGTNTSDGTVMNCLYLSATNYIVTTSGNTQAYTVTSGTAGLTLDFGNSTVDFNENGAGGITVYDAGLCYGGSFYATEGTEVSFDTQTAEDKVAVNVAASSGTLTGNPEEGYVLTMPAANVSVTATLDDRTVSSIQLYDGTNDPTNETTIAANADQMTNVTIKNRTLYKDNSWNTLCLPFNVSETRISAITNFKDCIIKELDVDGWYDSEGIRYDEEADGRHQTGFDSGTLYLYFKTVTEIEARRPYLIKWESGDNLVEPQFPACYIDNSNPKVINSTDGKVSFRGNYDPEEISGNKYLYLGTGNQLYYPSSPRTINAFHAYFQLNGIEAGEVAQARMFFGDNDETTGIVGVEHGILNIEHSAGTGWYDLSGRKLSGKPTQKGVFIYNGNKRIIK